MFRVTTHDEPGSLTFQVEGRLAGPCVDELADCWQRTLAGQRRPVGRVDLAGVTFVDAAGKALLAQLHRAGAELVASGVLMRAVVAEVTQATATPPEVDGGTKGGERVDR